jgi:hypothetical protein
MEECMLVIQDAYQQWGEGFDVSNVRYAGDDENNAENIKWLSDLADKNYTECVQILTDIRAPKEGNAVWEPNEEAKDYGWYLARENGGSWELVTQGY